MNIIWQYLDKRNGAINALQDYNSMQHIIYHTDEEIASVSDRMTSLGSPSFSDTPRSGSNPQGNENRIIAAIDEIDVLGLFNFVPFETLLMPMVATFGGAALFVGIVGSWTSIRKFMDV